MSLSHFDLRDYDAVIGRWLTTDPMNAGFTPYWGMNNNPVVGVDPTGGVCETCPKGSQYDGYRNNKATFNYSDGMVMNSPDVVVRPGITGYNGAAVVANAMKYANKFNYGDRNSKGCMDCSGFINKVLNESHPGLGNQIGVSTASMTEYVTNSGGFRTNNPKVGDLAFWNGHVEFVTNVGSDGSFTTFGMAYGIGPNSNWKTFSSTLDPNLSRYGTGGRQQQGKFKGFYTPVITQKVNVHGN